MTNSTLLRSLFGSITLLQKKDIFFNVILPLLLGIGIYELSNATILNGFFRNYLPDGLWAYSLVSSLLIIWNRRIKIFWIVLIFIFYIGFEVFQYIKVINGTGDYMDVLIYFGFSTATLLTNKYFINT